MQKIQFDYFTGVEAEQYSFYRVPKVCLLYTSCRFFGNFLERCRSPPSFRFTRQPVNRNGGT